MPAITIPERIRPDKPGLDHRDRCDHCHVAQGRVRVVLRSDDVGLDRELVLCKHHFEAAEIALSIQYGSSALFVDERSFLLPYGAK